MFTYILNPEKIIFIRVQKIFNLLILLFTNSTYGDTGLSDQSREDESLSVGIVRLCAQKSRITMQTSPFLSEHVV